MNKKELIDSVAEEAGLTKENAGEAIDAVFSSIMSALQTGEKVSIVGFGNFEVANRKASTGRNPRTGDPIEIPASKVPKFKPGKALKDAVNN
ncbi:MAG: HU family DNA-binding protein [Methyloligellaceae bacterium]